MFALMALLCLQNSGIQVTAQEEQVSDDTGTSIPSLQDSTVAPSEGDTMDDTMDEWLTITPTTGDTESITSTSVPTELLEDEFANDNNPIPQIDPDLGMEDIPVVCGTRTCGVSAIE